jgi:hypothetical protein
MPLIADESPEKQNHFMPSQRYKIISSEIILESEPTDIVIFPWNLSMKLGERILPSRKKVGI